jgi:ABC-type antimicrobial peptide transport system permease subunit
MWGCRPSLSARDGAGHRTLVLRGALRLVAAGTAAGIVSAIALTAALRSGMTYLPDAQAAEYLLPALILGASAVVAQWLPARQAARVDPARTLRTD